MSIKLYLLLNEITHIFPILNYSRMHNIIDLKNIKIFKLKRKILKLEIQYSDFIDNFTYYIKL
jgi:hypothetical protein